ncbi:hypothetical protein CYMTET_25513 [Cymbomonas tetramitiformis]|uniref:Uncharacterized protein n=1 Tax=Cymbomonas tetramitiformis TaxID=36881 RepID=A0AAE0KYU9_9CHLO|nr:hypothetical protein CYMTET_25513 [Cymbomonas tetramitiformis]
MSPYTGAGQSTAQPGAAFDAGLMMTPQQSFQQQQNFQQQQFFRQQQLQHNWLSSCSSSSNNNNNISWTSSVNGFSSLTNCSRERRGTRKCHLTRRRWDPDPWFPSVLTRLGQQSLNSPFRHRPTLLYPGQHRCSRLLQRFTL